MNKSGDEKISATERKWVVEAYTLKMCKKYYGESIQVRSRREERDLKVKKN